MTATLRSAKLNLHARFPLNTNFQIEAPTPLGRCAKPAPSPRRRAPATRRQVSLRSAPSCSGRGGGGVDPSVVVCAKPFLEAAQVWRCATHKTTRTKFSLFGNYLTLSTRSMQPHHSASTLPDTRQRRPSCFFSAPAKFDEIFSSKFV